MIYLFCLSQLLQTLLGSTGIIIREGKSAGF